MSSKRVRGVPSLKTLQGTREIWPITGEVHVLVHIRARKAHVSVPPICSGIRTSTRAPASRG